MSGSRPPARAAGGASRVPGIAAALLVGCGCGRATPSSSTLLPREASAIGQSTVRVPGALMVARALDALSVTIDPSSLVAAQVPATEGTFLGVAADAFVFAQGEARPLAERHGMGASAVFDVAAFAWNRRADGLPLPDTKYAIEMQLVLFATDVPPAREWEPRAGHYQALWTRTLRQAEE